MEMCKVCSVGISSDRRSRFKLKGDAAGIKEVYSELFDSLKEKYSEYPTSSFHSYLTDEPAFVCKSCFAAYKKYHDVKASILCLNEKLWSSYGENVRKSREGPARKRSHHDTATGAECTQPLDRTESELEEGPPRKQTRYCITGEPSACRRLNFNPVVAPSTASPPVTVVVSHTTRNKYHPLTSSLKKLGRFVGRGNRSSIAQAAVENTTLLPQIAVKLAAHVRRQEIVPICSDNHDSLLRLKSKPAVEHFTWESVWLELQQNAPILMSLLTNLLPLSKRNSESSRPVLCMCASILLKLQNPKMNLVQSMVSLLLKAGHATKQTFTRLQKLMISLSHGGMISLMDNIAEGHDEEVLEWQDEFSQMLCTEANNSSNSETETRHSQLVAPPALSLSLTSEELMEMETSFNLSGFSSPVTNTPEAPQFSPFTPPIMSTPGQVSTPLSPSPSGGHNLHDKSTPTVPLTLGNTTQEETGGQEASGHGKHGMKFVGDNIDKNVRPRHQTIEKQTRSLHYFNCYACLDRVDLSGLSDVTPSIDIKSVGIETVLPTSEDVDQLLSNFAVIACRILVKHIPALAKFDGITTDHIQHQHYTEMSKRSKVYPLGIIMKNENRLDEMVDILATLHKYVPLHEVTTQPEETQEKELTTQSEETQEEELTTQSEETQEKELTIIEILHKIIFGGDLLTAVRAKGAQWIRQNSEHPVGRLEGFIPVAEDWHAKVALLEVIWTRLYGKDSYAEAGTLLQLKSLINRSNVRPTVKKDVNAAMDFLQVILEGHILAAFLQHFDFSTPEDVEKSQFIQQIKNASDKRTVLQDMITTMLKEYVNIGTFPQPDVEATDGVFAYAKEVLSLALLWAEFEDAIKEGDGLRVITCWKFFLPIFKVTNHKNYSIGALNILLQYNVLLSPRQCKQLLWSRFINTSGKPGQNKSCDLHMEHLNRVVKTTIGGLESNVTPKSISRIGKCAGVLIKVCNQFDSISAVVQRSGKHGGASWTKDIKKITEQLNETKVYKETPGRMHPSFPELKKSLGSRFKMDKFKTWFDTQLIDLCL